MTEKREWHTPPKDIERDVEGKCPYCNQSVRSLNKHIHDRHKGEKPVKR